MRAALLTEHTAKASLDIVQSQLNAGQVNQIAVLNAQQACLVAAVTRVRAEANRLSDTAALFMALGRGWPPTAPAPTGDTARVARYRSFHLFRLPRRLEEGRHFENRAGVHTRRDNASGSGGSEIGGCELSLAPGSFEPCGLTTMSCHAIWCTARHSCCRRSCGYGGECGRRTRRR